MLLALAPTAYLGIAQLEGLLARVDRAIDKPVVAVGLLEPDRLRVDGLPVYAFPEGGGPGARTPRPLRPVAAGQPGSSSGRGPA